jgi:hypothetical protein
MSTLKCEQGISEKLGVGLGLVAATIGLLVITACSTSSNKQAIIAFTEQALAIEQQRNERAENPRGSFDRGLTARNYVEYIANLKVKLIALDSPKETQVIKDTLIEIYLQEQSSIRLVYQPPLFGCETKSFYRCQGENVWEGFYPRITRYNYDKYEEIDRQGYGSPWARAQCLRAQVYDNWQGILMNNGIDTAKFQPLETEEQMLGRIYSELGLSTRTAEETRSDYRKDGLPPKPTEEEIRSYYRKNFQTEPTEKQIWRIYRNLGLPGPTLKARKCAT